MDVEFRSTKLMDPTTERGEGDGLTDNVKRRRRRLPFLCD